MSLSKTNVANIQRPIKQLIFSMNFFLLVACSGSGSGGGTGGNAGGSTISGPSESTSINSGSSTCTKKNYGSPNFSCDCSHVNADLPFDYSLNSERLLLNTDGGAIETFISPWGAHTEPFTGHFAGNHKADWSAAYAGSFTEMTELTPSNRNGVCENGETCGVHRSSIVSRRLKYQAPDSRFMITKVNVAKGPSYKNEFQGEMVFSVEGWLCNYRYTFPYMSSLGSVLRQKMLEAGYKDPHLETEDKFGIPNSLNFSPENLIKGEPIVLEKGDEIGLLQIRAEPVPNYPDHFKGSHGMGIVPHAALEFTLDNLSLTDGYNTGIYRLLPQRTQDSLLQVLYSEAAKGENSLKFGTQLQNEWLWKAEMVLNASEPDLYQDYSSLFSWTGGWSEKPESKNCTGWAETSCDEIFAIFKIHKDTAFYNARLYATNDVSYLINANRGSGVMAGEVLSPAEPSPTSGVLLIKWRQGVQQYQKVAYKVEPLKKLMKVRWSEAAGSPNEIIDPAIPGEAELCDGEKVSCMDHEPRF